MFADELISTVQCLYRDCCPVEKSNAVRSVSASLGLRAAGKLYIPPHGGYAVRFSYSKNGSFSNTVLSLKKLIPYDHIPVISCLFTPNIYYMKLMNTTFLKKISHSSQALSLTNIRGSFNGSDIMQELAQLGLDNKPGHFEQLFRYHQTMDLQSNMERLVEETSRIKPIKQKMEVTPSLRAKIHESIKFSFRASPSWSAIKSELDRRVSDNYALILAAAKQDFDNVNLRGNKIEQLITNAGNEHGLEDVQFQLQTGEKVVVDIKTSVAGKSSNPKLYNIDKQLQALSSGRTACMIYFVHIDTRTDSISTYLVNSFDRAIIDHTRIQDHWSGRDSRGTTQLDMRIQQYFHQGWAEQLDLNRALQFIDDLINESFRVH